MESSCHVDIIFFRSGLFRRHLATGPVSVGIEVVPPSFSGELDLMLVFPVFLTQVLPNCFCSFMEFFLVAPWLGYERWMW